LRFRGSDGGTELTGKITIKNGRVERNAFYDFALPRAISPYPGTRFIAIRDIRGGVLILDPERVGCQNPATPSREAREERLGERASTARRALFDA
jgi:hypothetical protein